MSRRIDEGRSHGTPSSQVKRSIAKSPEGEQLPSSGGALGKGIGFYSRFMWVVTFAWVDVSFSDFRAKKELVSSLAKTMAEKLEKVQTKETALQKYFEKHFDALDYEQLNTLNQRFEAHPKLVPWFISRQNFRDLHQVLIDLTTEKAEACFQLLENTVKVVPQIPSEELLTLIRALYVLDDSELSTLSQRFENHPNLMPWFIAECIWESPENVHAVLTELTTEKAEIVFQRL
jgi:hypothetical protein